MKNALLFSALLLFPLSARAAVPDMSFTVAMSEPVTVTGCPGNCPRIVLDVGGVTRYANFSAGSGTSSLTFSYSPVAGDLDLDGISISSTSIDLNTSGTITDLNGNALSPLTFSAPNTSGLKINYPSLSMDFVNGRYTLNDTNTTNFSTFLTNASGTFTRASTATYFDASGVLQTASANTPRFDYDPITHTGKGLLIEEGRTNSTTYSTALENAAWGKVNSTISPNVAIAPDGTTTADKIIATGTNEHYAYKSAGMATPYTATWSAFLKAGEYSYAAVSFSNTVSLTARLHVNLATGAIVSAPSSNADWTILGTQVQSVGNGWYRFSISVTKNTATGGGGVVEIFAENAPTTTAYVADGTSGIYAWGAQFEVGAFPTSYIPTTTAAAVRNAEIFTFSLGSWFTSTEGTLFSSYTGAAPVGVSTRAISLNNSNTSNVFQIANALAGSVIAQKVVAGSGQSATGPTYVMGTTYKTAAAFDSSSGPLAVSGMLYSNNYAGIPSSLNRLDIGNQNTFAQLNGWIRTSGYYPLRAADTQLQLLTQ